MKILSKTLLLIFFLIGFCKAQNISELLEELKVSEDTTRVIVLTELSKAYLAEEAKPKKSKKSKNVDEAFKYASDALKLSRSLEYKKGISDSYFILGKIFLADKNYREAETAFLNSIELAKELKDHQLVLLNLDYIFRFHKELGKVNNTIAYADMKSQYKDVIIKELKGELAKALSENSYLYNQLAELNTVRDSLLQLNSLLQQEQVKKETVKPVKIKPIVVYRTKTDYTVIIIITLLLLVAVFIALYFFIIHKTTSRILTEAREKIIALEKANDLSDTQKEQSFEQNSPKAVKEPESNDFRTMQLLSQANFIIQKNDILLKLQNNFVGLKESKVEELSKKISVIANLITTNFDAGKDWTEFITYFENAFPNYLAKVKERLPDLSDLETKIVAMRKVNLTVHEMASILHMTEEELEKTLTSLDDRFSSEHV